LVGQSRLQLACDVSEIGEAIERDISDAITTAVAEHEHGMVTRWVGIDEIIDDEGERAVLTLASEDVRAWDTIGLLDFALTMERAALTAAKIRDEDE
jgi:hypothetical protein